MTQVDLGLDCQAIDVVFNTLVSCEHLRWDLSLILHITRSQLLCHIVLPRQGQAVSLILVARSLNFRWQVGWKLGFALVRAWSTSITAYIVGDVAFSKAQLPLLFCPIASDKIHCSAFWRKDSRFIGSGWLWSRHQIWTPILGALSLELVFVTMGMSLSIRNFRDRRLRIHVCSWSRSQNYESVWNFLLPLITLSQWRHWATWLELWF